MTQLPAYPSLPTITRLATKDSEELAAMMRGWEQEYIYLKKEQFEWGTTLVQIGQLQIQEVYCSGAILDRGVIESDHCAIGIPQHPLGDQLNLGQTISHHSLLKGQEYEYKADQGYKLLVMKTSIESVLACAEDMKRSLTPVELQANGVMIPNPNAYQQLQVYLKELIELAKTQPELLTHETDDLSGSSMGQLIYQDALPLFVDVLTAEPSVFVAARDCNRRHLVKQADAFMREHIDHPITVTDICREMVQSKRSLYYAFQENYGLPPMEYLKQLRLQHVRRNLKRSDPKTTSVTKVASSYGFWHMGQFSADYKKMFGESPSITLKGE